MIGDQGDYFYIVEKGQFTVLVNGNSVGTKTEVSFFVWDLSTLDEIHFMY